MLYPGSRDGARGEAEGTTEPAVGWIQLVMMKFPSTLNFEHFDFTFLSAGYSLHKNCV